MDLEEIVVILLVIAGLVRFPLKPGGIGRRLFGPRDSESWPWAKTNIGCGLVDAISGGEGGMAAPLAIAISRSQEIVRLDSRLSQNRAERPFRHVPWMIRHGCVAIRARMESDFMAAGGLAVELESARLQFPRDLPVSEPCQPSHSRRDDDRVVSSFTGGRQARNAVALAPGFDQFPCDVARDLKGLGNRTPLCHEAGKFIRCRKEHAFRQFLNLDSNRQFHTIDPTAPKPKSSPSRYRR